MFGPDGKPINLGAAHTIGGPKGLDDIPAFNDETIDELITGMEQMVQSGQPMEIPAAMPMGQLAGMARTIRDLRARVQELEAELADDEAPGNGVPKLDLSSLTP
jgi:hypothetical protein